MNRSLLFSGISLIAVLCVAAVIPVRADDAAKTPVPVVMADHAREYINKKCTVEMTVKASKNAVPRKLYYLDSEEDFHDEKNFAIVISYDHAAAFQVAGIDNPAEHYKGKTIRVTGTVIDEDDQVRIRCDDPKQITLVEPAVKPK
jgi:DNA/RNA endonuclease YhcR with UshA esterase domain